MALWRSIGGEIIVGDIMEKLPCSYNGYEITEFDELDSTNTYLTGLAKKSAPHGTTIIARRQTAGRGRQGRSFFSPETTGLYLSTVYRKGISVENALMLTPAVAVAVSKALESVSGQKMGIKWVNDIFSCGKKVCGILVESKLDFSSNCLEYAVIGIGINLFEPEGGFPEDIKNTAGALFPHFSEEIRLKTILALLDSLKEILDSLPDCGFMEDYRKRSILIGHRVDVFRSNEVYNAEVIGIDDSARLIVKSERGEERIDSGEVRVRL